MSETIDQPRIIQRKCGGWLAISARADPLQIGVTAPSEEQAITMLRKASDGIRSWLAAEATDKTSTSVASDDPSSANATERASPYA